MYTGNYDRPALFEQLGLDASPEGIETFIAKHRTLSNFVHLHEAPFWTASQARFLREELCRDGGWAEVVDELSERLRRSA